MEAAMRFSTHRPHLNKIDLNSFRRTPKKFEDPWLNSNWNMNKEERRNKWKNTWNLNALPDWPLMAVMVEHVIGSRDWVVTKSVWHLNDEEIKNDPFYDGESYRKDGGDGSVHWLYEKQEDIEEQARAELLREELIEEIEKKVGGLRELEEAKEEELVK